MSVLVSRDMVTAVPAIATIGTTRHRTGANTVRTVRVTALTMANGTQAGGSYSHQRVAPTRQ